MSGGDAADWLRHAEADLRYARLGRNEPGMLLNLAAFHAQQSIEKALKGLLVSDQVDFPRTHDLEELLQISNPIVVTNPRYELFLAPFPAILLALGLEIL
jgi:HEPN domain-containing protein